ncbi:MAG: AAA family ATPase [Chloroflexota bacterium]|nr:AAA family ATPase [Chloroflexota bacterium]
MSITESSRIRIFLLGRFEVRRGERVLRTPDWSRRKAAALLQRLALERRLLKEQAIEFLWPEFDPDAGANNLYRTLHALRSSLDRGLSENSAEETLLFEGGVLRLHETVWVDIHEFERLVSDASDRSSPESIPLLEEALALYVGELLPARLYDDWTLVPRESLHRQYREASLALSAAYGERREYSRAIEVLTPLLDDDPADEPVHRELMRLYALAGRRHDALRQYQTCVNALATQLDVPPDPQTEALYEQILSGELVPVPTVKPPSWIPPTPSLLKIEQGTPFVGRSAELERLCTLMQAARRGQGRTILVAGEAGIGKTRLAHEALRAAASAGMITIEGAAYEHEGQLPYQAFVEAFDRYLAECRQSPDGEDAEPLVNPITTDTSHGSGDPQQGHWALFQRTATFLTAVAAHAPVVLFVDDLHAADETSLRLFHYLARQTRTAPVVLLATYRLEEASDITSPFGTLLNELYRERLGETIRLRSLEKEAIAAIASHTLGASATPELIEAVFEITEGNPFFAEEISGALLSPAGSDIPSGQRALHSGAKLPVPTRLRELLQERVHRCGARVERALTAAAVLKREFRFEVLREMVSLDDGELLDALDDALAGRLLVESEQGYLFRHALIRRVLYESLSRPRRARLHTQAAEAIEAVYRDRPGQLATQVDVLAFHYELSDQQERALPYLLEAGQKAADMYAFEVAVDDFRRALALMDEFELEDPAQRWMILESLGWWGMVLADTPHAVASFEQALALSPTNGWRPARRDRVRLHCGAAMVLLTAGNTGAAEEHLEAALDEVDEDEDEAEYADLLYNMAQLHWHRNEYEAAYEAAQRSLAIAERLDNPEAVARAFEMLALACHSLGEWQEGLSYEEQRAALAGPALDVTDAFDVHL